MQAADLDTDFDPEMPRARAGRALALIAVSVVAIIVTSAIYLRPTFGPAPASPWGRSCTPTTGSRP